MNAPSSMIESFCSTAGNDDTLLCDAQIKALIKLLLSEEQTDFEDLKDSVRLTKRR